MKKYIYAMFYNNKNFGDDLFLRILCAKYSDYRIITYGVKRNASMFSDINNLEYEYDTILTRIIDRIIKIVNKKLGLKYETCHEKKNKELLRSSIFNVRIIGSWFIDKNFSREEIDTFYNDNISSFNEKFALVSCNYGPSSNDYYYNMVGKLIRNAHYVCFREQWSYELFKTLDNVSYAPDAAFLSKKYMKYGYDSKFKNSILVCVVNIAKDEVDKENQKKYEDTMTQLCQYLYDRGEKLIFLNLCNPQLDDMVTQNISKRLSHKEIEIVNYDEFGMSNTLTLFNSCKAVIACRYHAMIMAALFKKKCVPFFYSKKMYNVNNDLKLYDFYLDINNDLTNINLEELYDVLENGGHFIDVDKICELANDNFNFDFYSRSN